MASFTIKAILLTLLLHSVTSTTISEFMGVNIHFTSPRSGEMDMIKAGGWNWVRMDFIWSDIEKVKGEYDFSDYDILVSNLESYGMKAILILDYGNTLYDGGFPPHSSEAVVAFVKWAMAGINRYKGKGMYWECWNEPNGDAFWKPKHNATAYAHLCMSLGKEMKASFPNEVFLGPAIANMNHFESLDFAADVFKHGALDFFDIVSTHGYDSKIPEQWLEFHEEMRILTDQFSKGKSMAILNSEWGYNSIDISEEKQGQYIARAYLTTITKGTPVHIWYDWHDDCLNNTYSECFFGTVRYQYYPNRTPVFDPKPAYIAAQTLSKTLGGCEYSHRLLPQVLQPLEQGLAFSCNNTNTVAYAVWTLSTIEKHAKIKVENGGCFSVIDYLGVDRGIVCAEGEELIVKVSEGPLYLLAKT